MKLFQQILRGSKDAPHLSSNRGIRYRRLRPSEVDAIHLKAARMVAGLELSDAERGQALRGAFLHEAVKAMLVFVTKEPVALAASPETEDPLADEKLWEPLTIQKLTEAGPYHYDELFEPVDHHHLKYTYSRNHEASAEAVADIVKKELPVSTG